MGYLKCEGDEEKRAPWRNEIYCLPLAVATGEFFQQKVFPSHNQVLFSWWWVGRACLVADVLDVM